MGVKRFNGQPPSGGCVLKRTKHPEKYEQYKPAAFGRLCVETSPENLPQNPVNDQPPSGGCVLKLIVHIVKPFELHQPPSGGCVLKPRVRETEIFVMSSRLRAAVC